MLLIAFAIFLFPIEEYFYFSVIFIVCNLIIYYSWFFSYVKYSGFNVYVLCIFTVLNFLTLYIKRKISSFFRENYLQAYKFSKYNFYFEEIINNMNGYLISTNENKVEFTNKSFNDYFIKHRKMKKFLKPIAEKNDLIKFIAKNPNLIQKKFIAEDYIDIKIFEKTRNQSKEKTLFLKFFKKEIKMMIKDNKSFLEEKKETKLDYKIYDEKENAKNKEIILENLNANEVKLETKTDKENEQKDIEYQILENFNSKIKKENLRSLNTGSDHDCESKIINDEKKTSEENKQNNTKTKIPPFSEGKINKKCKNLTSSAKEYLFSNEILLKKFEEFKINFNQMEKVYLENLYPTQLNISKKQEKRKSSIEENNFNNTLSKENQNQNIKKNKEFANRNNSDFSDKEEKEEENATYKKIFMDLNINLEKRNLLQISEIIQKKFHGKNKFYYLGRFKNIKDKKYYQIYFRKNCIRSINSKDKPESESNTSSQSSSDPEFKIINPIVNVNINSKSKRKNFDDEINLAKKGTVDFLIYDISKFHETEKLESKLKSKFLGKIAHEFKTPINSILGLIKRIMFNLENEENDFVEFQKDIKQVENLCSYTLFLIDDIIEYSFKSNYANSLIYSDKEDLFSKNRDSLADSKAKSEADYLITRNKKQVINENNKLFSSFENLKNINNKKIDKMYKEIKKENYKNINNGKKAKEIFASEESQSSYIADEGSNFNEYTYNLYSKSENIAKKKIILRKNFSSESEKMEKSSENKNEKNNKNNLVINKKEINLSEITSFCRGVAETLLISKGKESNIKILSNFNEEIYNYKIISDQFRIKQILLNFLSNSVKFTKSGLIIVKSFLIENNSKIKISIIDSGVGIKETELKYLFTDKFMSESTKVLNQAGSGLGLSISKSISDKLGFLIEVKSEFGKGSEFSLIINCKRKRKKRKLKFGGANSENREINEFNNKTFNDFSNNKITLRSKFKKEECEFDEEILGSRSFSRFNNERNKKEKQLIHKKSNYEEDSFEKSQLSQGKNFVIKK
jgi:signal transduction histidine kinase